MTPEKKTIPNETSETSQKTVKSFISPLVIQSCLTLCYPMDSSTPTSFALHYQSLLRFMPIETVMLSNHLILCPHFSVSLQSFPASGSFQMSLFFPSGGQSIGASASASVLPMNILCCSPLGWTGFICLLFEGLSVVSSSITIQKHQFFGAQPSLWFTSHICSRLLEKLYRPLTIWASVGKVMSLLSKMFISFPP